MIKVKFLILLPILCFCFKVGLAQNGLDLDGTNDFINTNQPPVAGVASRTIEAWVKIPSTVPTTQAVIVDMGTMTTGGRFTLNVLNGQNLRIEVAGSGFNSPIDITDNNWHHVAVTFNNSNPAATKAKLYVDGILSVQGNLASVNTAATGNIRIGSRVDGINLFRGLVDEVRVWNVERTATQILADMNNEFCVIPPNLIAYYRLNQGLAGGNNTGLINVINAANGLYSGTLTNFALTGLSSNWVVGKVLNLIGAVTSTINPISCGSYTSPNNNIYTSSGTYYDTLISSAGCDSIITINLTIGVAPIANLAVNNVTGSAADLSWNVVPNSTGYEYVLNQNVLPPLGAGTFTVNTFYNPTTLTPLSTYYMHVRTICGGNYSDWETISFTTLCAAPVIHSVVDSFRCGSGSIMLQASGSGTAVNWYTSASGGSPVHVGSTFNTPPLSTTTTYYVGASNLGCEGGRVPVLATIRTNPNVTLGPDLTMCPGQIISLEALGSANVDYLWNTGAISNVITVNIPGTYSVIVNDGFCEGQDTVLVSTAPVPTTNMMDTVKICSGQSILLDAENAGATFFWNNGTSAQTLSVSQEGIYKVLITNSYNCTIEDSTYLALYALPVLALGNDTFICSNAPLIVDAANPNASYVWSTGDTTQTIAVSQSGSYNVVVTDSNNCFVADTIEVSILPIASVDGFNFIPQFEIEQGRVQFQPINPLFTDSFLWSFGDGNTSIDQSPVYVYASSGVYLVNLKVSNNCGFMDTSLSLNVDLFLGVNSYDNKKPIISVYPNPIVNKVVVESIASNIFIRRISVFNILGQNVYRKSEVNRSKVSEDLSFLHSGNYVLVVDTNEGKVVQNIVIE